MQNTKLSVVDKKKTATEQLKNIYSLTEFPTPENAPTRMAIEDFLKLPPFPTQRGHEERAKKLVPLLTKPMFGHNEVDICIYEGPTTMSPAPFQKDKTYVLNGHTRQYVWSERIRGNMVHSKVDHIPIPQQVVVNVYKFTDSQAAIDFYYSRDSLVAVEKKPDMVVGALRACNVLANIQSTRIKKRVNCHSIRCGVSVEGKIYLSCSRGVFVDRTNFYDERLYCGTRQARCAR